MKTRKTNYFLYLIAVSMAFISCKKSTNENALSSNISPQKLSLLEVENDQNPYDFLGKKHNQLLDSLNFEDIDSAQIINFIGQKLDELTPANNTDLNAIEYLKDNLSEIAPVKDGESIASVLNDPIYGNDVNIASDLIQRLDAVYLMDDLALMINEIKNIEAETMELFDIENNPNMMATTILGTSSVLRHSLYYWYEYNELHPGAQGDWNKIGNADAASFSKAATATLIGAGIPATAVTIVNPWLVLAGWGIATVVGSAYEAGSTWGWW